MVRKSHFCFKFQKQDIYIYGIKRAYFEFALKLPSSKSLFLRSPLLAVL